MVCIKLFFRNRAKKQIVLMLDFRTRQRSSRTTGFELETGFEDQLQNGIGGVFMIMSHSLMIIN
jgi:hypothetical protein